MFYTCNYNIRVTHRNGAITHFLRMNQIHGGIISRLFFIHLSLHALALHLAVNITSNLSAEDYTRWPYIHLSVVFPSRMPIGPHLLRNQYYYENIPNI